ncbi:hypothetical protein GCK72_004202 [Caenorhabditis remanei]|uniref:F-box associated domain-containing protein n=1 Tax=Caenorhabditis remanei TaxID=31234 RepID=A0A6A5HAN5_CAERE|nr:hypothetical protein GCK72_004202 [Caenorhabditis remanei]KAF1764255.1 hypothetical protein GCK72_004202 [Caenorhabditis remanei]
MKIVVQCLNMKPTNLMYLLGENQVLVVATYDNNHNQIDHDVANVEFVPAIPSDEIKPMKCIETFLENMCSHSLQYLAQKEITVLESLQRHMKDLFRFKPSVQLELSSLHYINISRIIDDVTDTYFDVEELDTEQIENYLAVHPGQESVHLKTKITGPLLGSNSKVCSIKGLAVQGTQDQTPRLQFSEVINNFGGEYLIFIDVAYNVNDWAQLIRRWKSKQAYHKLKCAYATPPDEVSITFEHTMRQFDFVEWDGQRRPRTVKMDPKIIYLRLIYSEDIDCTEWMDIQQDGGGKWASVKVTQDFIRLVVWD